MLLDAVVITSGWGTALVLTNITIEVDRSTPRSVVMTIIAAITTLALMERRGLYAGRPALPRTDEISRVFMSVLGGAAAITVAAAFLDWHIGAREILLGWVLVFGGRTLARGMIRALTMEIPEASRPEVVVIVGTGDEASGLVDLIEDHPESRFALAGVIGNLSVAERSGLVDRWIGPTSRLIELMHQHEATGAIVTATGFRGGQFREITSELFRSGYDVHLSTGISRMGEGRFSVRSLSHEPLVVMERNHAHGFHVLAKRAVDILGASVLLLLASPVMALTALAIKIEDRGPVIYAAPRAGRRGQFFDMLKFRSMVADADKLKAKMQAENERTGPLFKMSNDPRITRIGRFIRETSIDELPQLINVLKGEMSLVGPRPALPEEEAAFDDELRDRFVVRPGITGLWQVEARSNAAFNAYRRLDLHYVENWNLSLDFRILLATVEQVVISVTLLPLKAMRRSGTATDGIVAAKAPQQRGRADEEDLDPDVIIDLRDRSRARLAEAEANVVLPSPPPAPASTGGAPAGNGAGSPTANGHHGANGTHPGDNGAFDPVAGNGVNGSAETGSPDDVSETLAGRRSTDESPVTAHRSGTDR
ncbi:MAG: sugar transferase [Actinomycetota bacterium]